MSRIRDRLQRGGAVLTILVALALVVAACGSDADPAAETSPVLTSAPPVVTTAPPIATTMPATTPTPVPTAASTTMAPRSLTYALTSHGAGAIAPLDGARGMLGSGCTPGGDTLADGIWFGYVVTAAASELSLDLTCLHPGTPPMLTNDLARLREVPVDTDTVVFPTPTAGVPYDLWEPEPMPVWIYINDGMATEIAYPTSDYMIDTGWTAKDITLPVAGGCCGTMYQGPASPTKAWPMEGLPADGVYAVDVETDAAAGDYVLTIRRFVSCDAQPAQCVPGYEAGGMFIEDEKIVRRVDGQAQMTVRIIGVDVEDGTTAIEGLGNDLAALHRGIQESWDEYIQPKLDAGWDTNRITEELIRLGEEDPEFPYGAMPSVGGVELLGYRGPQGIFLYDVVFSHQTLLDWATQLEIVDGRPILYIEAGRIAG